MSRTTSGEAVRWFRVIALLPFAVFGTLLVSVLPAHGAAPDTAEASRASHGVRMAFAIYGTSLVFGYGAMLAHEWRTRLANARRS